MVARTIIGARGFTRSVITTQPETVTSANQIWEGPIEVSTDPLSTETQAVLYVNRHGYQLTHIR